MTDQRARVVLDAPISPEALGLLTPMIAQEIAEEIRTVFQNALIQKGIATRYEGDQSVARVHVHNESPCMGCREHTLDGMTNY